MIDTSSPDSTFTKQPKCPRTGVREMTPRRHLGSKYKSRAYYHRVDVAGCEVRVCAMQLIPEKDFFREASSGAHVEQSQVLGGSGAVREAIER
jgi:hypothetical protein